MIKEQKENDGCRRQRKSNIHIINIPERMEIKGMENIKSTIQKNFTEIK